jgi:hypothetical protein
MRPASEEARPSFAQAIEGVLKKLARAEGRRDALRCRHEALEREIALAKGRLAIRGAVERFIEEAQAEASRRNLAHFETLLTALVRDVLPGEKPVALDLSTERGLAALDICVRRPDGTLEDVLEDNGGALTNVIGMALRLIAVVKAGAGRFLALDEADCWIAPERVPAFYRVLEDSAARLGVQCLAISHHDLSGFDSRLSVRRTDGAPADGVRIVGPDPEPWDDAAPGLRFVRLIDVQGYRHATLTLGPGVNALVGPNNRGKSTVIRALRAVFYGEARDSLVRAGARTATVEIGVAGGSTLRFSRQPRRTPVNVWSLHEPDGSVVLESGTRLETGGRAVPEWVEKKFGIAKVEDLDVHVAHQKFPVFLLGEPPSRRSAVLSIGQEAGYLRDMLAIHRERCARDMALVRTGERELIAIQDALAGFQSLPALADDVDAARAQAAALAAAAARLDALTRRAAAIGAARQNLAQARAKAGAFAGLPGPERVAEIAAAVERARERERIGERVLTTSKALAVARRRLVALADLPAAMPPLADTGEAERTRARLATLGAGIDGAERQLAAIDEGLAAVEAEIACIVAETGGCCPTCGGAVDNPLALLHDHAAHAGPAREAA